MNKLLYLILFFLVLPFTGFTQTDSITLNDKQQPTFNNQIDLDLEVLAFSFGYKRRISKNWLVGPSIGVGLAGNIILTDSRTSTFSSSVVIEAMHLGVTFRYYKTKRLQFEIEPRVNSLTNLEYGINLAGVGFGIYYGGRLQIGVRTMLGLFDVDDIRNHKRFNFINPILTSSLIIIRIPVKW